MKSQQVLTVEYFAVGRHEEIGRLLLACKRQLRKCIEIEVNSIELRSPSSRYSYYFSGQQRSRMLATLFKDERCQQLAAYGILEKMYLDRIIRGNQLQEFAAMLMPHQKATTADGTWVS